MMLKIFWIGYSMNDKKCPFCGGYLPSRTFYYIKRVEGILNVWICPNCGQRIKEWRKEGD